MVKTTSTATAFAAYLESLMEKAGYTTPAALARASGVTDTTIGRWLKGEKEPTIAGLRAVAPCLRVRVGDLLVRAIPDLTAAELGLTGTPPPALPPVVRDILARLDPRAGLTEKEKRILQAAMRRALESFDEFFEELHSAPTEPAMRRTVSGRR